MNAVNSEEKLEETLSLLEKTKQKTLSKRQKQLSSVMIVIGIIFAFLVGSPLLGSMLNHNIDTDEDITGWCSLSVYYMGLNKEIQEFSGSCKIDLYNMKNGTKYTSSLTLDNFPYYLSEPTSILFNDSSGEFEPYYGMLVGNPDKNNPYENIIFLRREVYLSNIAVHTSLFNYTYSNYSNIDPYDPTITEYMLEYKASSTEVLPFGDFSPQLSINVSLLPFGYSWGVNSIIPPDIFATYQSLSPIAYQNQFDWKGLFLGFDGKIDLRLLYYGAETYTFFESIQIFCINLTSAPSPDQLWIAQLPTVDIPSSVIIEFSALSPVSHIYLWSGIVDDYTTQLVYNSYTMKEVI